MKQVSEEDWKLIEAVHAALKRGHDVQIQRRSGGIVLMEVSRKIKYRSSCQSGQGKSNQS